tara:strand:+ start:72 stop:230 length:159 start_codon:yes stop_codon:yes gene_type:complete
MKNKPFSVRKVNRYVVIDSRTGMVQVVFAKNQREANLQALSRFRANGASACA